MQLAFLRTFRAYTQFAKLKSEFGFVGVLQLYTCFVLCKGSAVQDASSRVATHREAMVVMLQRTTSHGSGHKERGLSPPWFPHQYSGIQVRLSRCPFVTYSVKHRAQEQDDHCPPVYCYPADCDECKLRFLLMLGLPPCTTNQCGLSKANHSLTGFKAVT